MTVKKLVLVLAVFAISTAAYAGLATSPFGCQIPGPVESTMHFLGFCSKP